MAWTSNLVEILINRFLRPHGIVVTSWPLVDQALSTHFMTNLVEIFIRGSTDLINIWLHSIEFGSFPGL